MADQTCHACSQPVRDTFLCNDCTKKTRRHLANQAAYHNQLVTEQTRMTKKIAENDGGKSSAATTWARAGDMYLADVTAAHLREWDRRARAAGQLIFEQHNLLVSWTKLTVDEYQALWPADTINAMSKHLAANLGHLRKHAAAKELRLEWRDLSARILKVIDLPEYRMRLEAGPCPMEYPYDGDGGVEFCTGIVEMGVPHDSDLPAWLRCLVCKVEWPAGPQWYRAGQAIKAREETLKRQKVMAAAFQRRGAA